MSTCHSVRDNILEDFLVRYCVTLEWSSADNEIKWLVVSFHSHVNNFPSNFPS